MTSPDEPVRSETFIKRAGLSWAWYAGGGALLVLLLAAVLLIRGSRRRRADEQLLRAWEEIPEGHE